MEIVDYAKPDVIIMDVKLPESRYFTYRYRNSKAFEALSFFTDFAVG